MRGRQPDFAMGLDINPDDVFDSERHCITGEREYVWRQFYHYVGAVELEEVFRRVGHTAFIESLVFLVLVEGIVVLFFLPELFDLKGCIAGG